MDQNIRAAIARITAVGPKGPVRGTAFLVAGDLVATALHNVADRREDPFRPFEQISLQFPGHATEATLVDHDREADCAVLRCTHPPPAELHQPLSLRPLERSGDEWEAWGYPNLQRKDGLTVNGVIDNHLGELNNGKVIQLSCKQLAAGVGGDARGLSGGPVLVRDQVVGLLRFALGAEDRTAGGTLYACPIQKLIGKAGLLIQAAPKVTALLTDAQLAMLIGSRAHPYARKVQEFVEITRGPRDAPAPFAGREGEFHHLENWLRSSTIPRYLLIGPAGRGKSALLLEWLSRYEQNTAESNDRYDVVFVPISLRVGTYVPGIFFQMLACRLAAILRKEIPAEHADAGLYYEGLCGQICDELISTKRRVMIVVDGVDEALDDSFRANWFSAGLGSTVKLVVSARETLGKGGGQSWLSKFDWTANRNVVVQELAPLAHKDIWNLLVSIPFKGQSFDFLKRVTERLQVLTEGEPLLLRFYAEDLRERSGLEEMEVLEFLAGALPGLSGYFDRWWILQRDAWKREGTNIEIERLNAHLAVLACALGPVEADDLGQIVALAHGYAASSDMNETLWPVRRFVIGDGLSSNKGGRGYVLAHPRLRDFFLEKFTKEFVNRTRAAFITWGKRLAQEINDGKISPAEASPYVVSFLTKHLEDAGEPAVNYLRLFDRGWVQACEHVEGSLRGFASDVRRAEKAAQLTPTHDGPRHSLYLSARLLSNSIRNAVLAPPELLIAALDSNQLGWTQVEARLEQFGAYARARGLSQLSLRVPESQRERILGDALAAARTILQEDDKAIALGEIAGRFPESEAQAIEEECLAATAKIGMLAFLHDAMELIVPQLRHETLNALNRVLFQVRDNSDWEPFAGLLASVDAALRPIALNWALSTHRRFMESKDHEGEGSFRGFSGYALSVLYPYLAEGVPGDEWGLLLATARSHEREYMRAWALVLLAPFSPATLIGSLIEEAIAEARKSISRLFLLRCLVKLLPFAERQRSDQLLQEAFAICVEDNFSDSYLAVLAPKLPASMLDDVFASLLKRGKGGLKSFVVLAPYLSASQIVAALNSLRANDDQRDSSTALLAFAAHLDDDERSRVQVTALHALSGYTSSGLPFATTPILRAVHPELRATVFEALLAEWKLEPGFPFDATQTASYIPDELLQDVFCRIQAWDGHDPHGLKPQSLAVLLARLDENACLQFRNFAYQQADPWYRAALSSSIATRLSGDGQTDAIRVALEAISCAPEPDSFQPARLAAHALTHLASVASDDVRVLVVEKATALIRRRPLPWWSSLIPIAALVPDADRVDLCAEVRAKCGDHPAFLPRELADLLPFVAPAERKQMISTILDTLNYSHGDRFSAINSVVGCLPPDYDDDLVTSFLDACDQIPRYSLFAGLVPLAPILARLEGAHGARVVVDGINAAARCFP